MNDVQLYLLPEAGDTPRAGLSAEEQERADRFVFPEDRALYIRAHALLRKVVPGVYGSRGRGADLGCRWK